MCIHTAGPPGEYNKFSSARKMKRVRNVLRAAFVRKGIKEVSEIFCRVFFFLTCSRGRLGVTVGFLKSKGFSAA